MLILSLVGNSTPKCRATPAFWQDVAGDNKASLEFFTPSCSQWHFFHSYASRTQVLLLPVSGQSAKISNGASAAGRSDLQVNTSVSCSFSFGILGAFLLNCSFSLPVLTAKSSAGNIALFAIIYSSICAFLLLHEAYILYSLLSSSLLAWF